MRTNPFCTRRRPATLNREAGTQRYGLKPTVTEARASGDARLADFSHTPNTGASMLNVHVPSPTATPLSNQSQHGAQPAVPPFNLSERQIWPGCHEIVVEGELDLAVVDQPEPAFSRAAERKVHPLLDLGACSFPAAACLGALVCGHETLPDRRCQLLLYGVNGQVR